MLEWYDYFKSEETQLNEQVREGSEERLLENSNPMQFGTYHAPQACHGHHTYLNKPCQNDTSNLSYSAESNLGCTSDPTRVRGKTRPASIWLSIANGMISYIQGKDGLRKEVTKQPMW